jgi:hypothetical protein
VEAVGAGNVGSGIESAIARSMIRIRANAERSKIIMMHTNVRHVWSRFRLNSVELISSRGMKAVVSESKALK